MFSIVPLEQKLSGANGLHLAYLRLPPGVRIPSDCGHGCQSMADTVRAKRRWVVDIFTRVDIIVNQNVGCASVSSVSPGGAGGRHGQCLSMHTRPCAWEWPLSSACRKKTASGMTHNRRTERRLCTEPWSPEIAEVLIESNQLIRERCASKKGMKLREKAAQ